MLLANAASRLVRSLAIGIIACVVLGHRPLWAEVDWHPEETWVFAVGVLQWQHPDIWPGMASAQPNRSDAQLIQFFHKSGIDANRIVYLQDRQATRARIQQELVTQLARTSSDDLLMFYFAGHGFRDHHNHQVHLANYDAVDGVSAWSVRSVFDTLEAHFKGRRVILMADCCYSGGLADEARNRKSQLGYACLCSSHAHNSSTGNWTFTDSLVAGLRDHPTFDLNSDGEIDIGEMGQYGELEMAFVERQKAVCEMNHAFPSRWRIAKPSAARLPRQGDRLEVEWKGKWYRAEILEAAGDRCRIHYAGFEQSWDEWVSPDRMRPFQPKHFEAGLPIEVMWRQDRKWYPAKVIRNWYGLTYIHYEGFSQEWDEWVSPELIRLPQQK